jgi:MYXO-CTERM domain-containing protein
LQEVCVSNVKRILAVALLLAVGGVVTPGISQTTDRTVVQDDDDGFDDWGLLGLLGLAGLMGRKRRDRDVVETRRV